jgi:Co/Zn/Cd efflux system component
MIQVNANMSSSSIEGKGGGKGVQFKEAPTVRSLFDGRRNQVTTFQLAALIFSCCAFSLTLFALYRMCPLRAKNYADPLKVFINVFLLVEAQSLLLEISRLLIELDPVHLTIDVTHTMSPLVPSPDEVKQINVRHIWKNNMRFEFKGFALRITMETHLT